MATILRSFVLLCCCAVAVTLRAASEVRFAEPASWVEQLPEPPLTPTPAEDVSHGYDYLLLHEQVNAAEQSTYNRNVYRITSDGALQSGARLTWDFDPSYEKLTLHHVRVLRGNEIQNRLNETSVRVIQRERDLDRHLLDGELTAFVLLDDIRVGDVIDYAFTRTGWNPTFGGRYFDVLSTAWSVPVRHQRFRLDVPAERTVRHCTHGTGLSELVVTRQGASDSYVWEARDLRPIEAESESPDWFTRYSFIQFSEFSEWAQVVAWAAPLYEVPDPPAPELIAKATELTAGLKTADAKTVAILQFVQQEVRYLGMELGAGSYRPTQPAEVLARRFGDCKDKTLLLCTLLRAAGVTASPALLHTDYGRELDHWLPSPKAFDHVIACLETEKGVRWIDPTLTYQQGWLDARGLPDYERALVIKPGTTGLSLVEVPPAARRSTRIEEKFEITAFDRPAKLEVVTRSTGRSADSARRYFAQTTPEQIEKEYVNYYSSVYAGIKSLRPVTWSDDRERNVVVAVETYEVPNLWEKRKDGELEAEFFPKNITEYTTRPQQPVRSSPLAIAYPGAMELTTTVHLPENWSIKPEDHTIDGGAFRGRTAITGEGRVVTMSYRWESLADHVPAERVSEYVKALNAFRETLGYTLIYRGSAVSSPAPAAAAPVATGFRLNWRLVLLALVTLAGATTAAVWIYRWPAAADDASPLLVAGSERLAGLGGWLVLVGIGVTLRPLILLFQLAGGPWHAFNHDTWERLTTPGDAAYQRALGPVIVAENVANLILFVTSVLLVALFYRKKRAFPGVFVFMLAFALLVQGLDNWAAYSWITGAKTDWKTFAQAAGQALIWIPYALVSRRVKATFVH